MLFFFVFLGEYLVCLEIWCYFVVEEIEIGFFIVNLVKDIGLRVDDFVVRGVRVIFDDYKLYLWLD